MRLILKLSFLDCCFCMFSVTKTVAETMKSRKKYKMGNSPHLYLDDRLGDGFHDEIAVMTIVKFGIPFRVPEFMLSKARSDAPSLTETIMNSTKK